MISLSRWPARRPPRRGPRADLGVGVVLSAGLDQVMSVADALASLEALAEGGDVPVEVLVVPWGTGDRCLLESVVAGSTLPVRLVASTYPTGNAARNAGVARVAGSHALLLDPLTRMRPGSLRRLLDAATSGRERRVVRAVGERNPFNPASWIFPTDDTVAGGPTFDERHGDRPDATCARAAATGPIRIEGQLWDRARPAGSADGAMPAWSDRIESWLAMVPEVRQLAPEPDKAWWIRELVRCDLTGLLADAERLPYELLPLVADVIGAVLATLHPDDLARLPVEARATAWLGGQARWTELAEVLARRSAYGRQFPTRVEGTRIMADLPGIDWQSVRPPVPMLELGPEESRLRVSVRRVRWDAESSAAGEPGGHSLAVDLFALVPHLDLSESTVLARWVGPGEPVHAVVRPRPDPALAVVSALAHQDQSRGSVTVVTAPSVLAAMAPGAWRLEVAVTTGGVVRTGRASERDTTGSAGALHASPDGAVRPVWDTDGLCLDVARPGAHERPAPAPGPVVRSVRAEGRQLLLEVLGKPPSTPSLVSRGTRIEGRTDGHLVCFDLDARASGRYRLVAGDEQMGWHPDGEESTGFDLRGAQHRIGVRRTPHGGVLLDLRPPLRDDEMGPHAQLRLQAVYDRARALGDTGDPGDPDDVVLLESDLGRTCSGSPAAVDRELARTCPDRRRIWVVRDHSVPVPEGATSCLRHSREWFDLLARASLLVVDGELPGFFSRRRGQVVLQTLGRHPTTPVGVERWEERNLSPTRIEHLVSRSAKQWSALTVPGPAQEQRLRKAFRYDGEVFGDCLPRTDLLLDPDAAERGRQTRHRLGIDPRRTVLFYAPEPDAHRVYDGRPREVLDVVELATALGPGCTVLLYRASGPAGGIVPGGRVIDVSEHPEVSDLMLASDAALFDYSALRFDYAVLERPMLFQVPDASVRRGDERGFPVPYAETAPGPVAVTVADVVALMGDLERVRREQAPALARFNARFNPRADGKAAARVLEALPFGTED